MPSLLLENTRKLRETLQNAGPDGLDFSHLTNVLVETLKKNIFVVSKKGKVLSYSITGINSSIPYKTANDKTHISENLNMKLLLIDKTETGIPISRLVNTSGTKKSNVKLNVIPVKYGGNRLGTLIIEAADEISTSDLILAEYCSTILSIELMRATSSEIEDEARKKADVQMAIGTLSYSELEAIEHVFAELDGDEGLLVASKIADRVGITRSVIVNALRKFESAGVIESRSLGMKGTHIKILNDKLLPELQKLK